ncbi:MAG: hypothetical protein BWY75_02902 [bacterium ADurb.Bin425]|nr:MAG: hypothetical protein BWY75_02902 [bacterium ADurb.Bin425]
MQAHSQFTQLQLLHYGLDGAWGDVYIAVGELLHYMADLRLVGTFGANHQRFTKQVFGFFVENLSGGAVDDLHSVVAVTDDYAVGDRHQYKLKLVALRNKLVSLGHQIVDIVLVVELQATAHIVEGIDQLVDFFAGSLHLYLVPEMPGGNLACPLRKGAQRGVNQGVVGPDAEGTQNSHKTKYSDEKVGRFLLGAQNSEKVVIESHPAKTEVLPVFVHAHDNIGYRPIARR